MTLQVPLDIHLMVENLLMSFKPECHLQELVLIISCAICILCEVNVQLLYVLGIVVVGSTEKLDRNQVVIEKMEFGDVPVVPDAKINEDHLVAMETA